MSRPSLSPPFTLFALSLTLMMTLFVLLPGTEANLDPAEEQSVKELIKKHVDLEDEVAKVKAEYEKQVAALKGIDLRKAFHDATGHDFTTVVIIIVIVLTVPSILVNVAFLLCQCALKSGVQVACCCCTNVCKCGGKLVCCCCKLCGKVLCPCCTVTTRGGGGAGGGDTAKLA